MPTRNDVIALAHRNIGVLSADEVPTAEQNSFAGGILDAIYEELISAQGIPIAWTLDYTPNKALVGLAQTLSSDIAGHYGVQYLPRSRGIARLRAALVSDDRFVSNDFGDAFVISQGEVSPSLVYRLYPSSTVLTGGSVVFNMRDEFGEQIITAAAATIVTATGTPTVQYDWTATDTKNVGRFRADFTVTYADATTETFPALNKIPVLITDPMGTTADSIDNDGEYF